MTNDDSKFRPCFPIILVLLSMLISPVQAEQATLKERERLSVFVCEKGYFGGNIESWALSKFIMEHPSVEIVVTEQIVSELPSNADIYLLSSTLNNIYEIISDDRFIPLESLISKDTREHVMIPQALLDSRNSLKAVPLFLGSYMLKLQSDMGIGCKRTICALDKSVRDSWSSLAEWGGKLSSAQEALPLVSGISIFAYQLNLMAYDEHTKVVNFDRPHIKSFLMELKLLAQKGQLYIKEPVDMLDAKLPHEGVFALGFGSELHERALGYEEVTAWMLPYARETNSSPIMPLIGLVDRRCKNKSLAVDFLESIMSADAQLQRPTTGLVRKDLRSRILKLIQENQGWAQFMKEVWGTPVSQLEYEQYLFALQHGRIVIGSFAEHKKTIDIVVEYVLGRISLLKALEALDVALREMLPNLENKLH